MVEECISKIAYLNHTLINSFTLIKMFYKNCVEMLEYYQYKYQILKIELNISLQIISKRGIITHYLYVFKQYDLI